MEKNTNSPKEKPIQLINTYASYWARTVAFTIDFLILSILRSFVFSFFSSFVFHKQVIRFNNDFIAAFGEEISNDVVMGGKYLIFWINHPIFKYLIFLLFLMILMGAIYYSLLLCSSWSSSIGGRIMNIYFMKKDEETKLTFVHALIRYITSLIPWTIAHFLMTYQLLSQAGIINFVINKGVIILLVIIAFAWFEMMLFTKRKTAAHDLICGTVVLKGKRGNLKINWKNKI